MPGSIYQPEGGQPARGPPRCLALLSPPPPAGQDPPPEPEPGREREAPPPPAQDEAAALRFALDQLSLLGLEEAGERGRRAAEPRTWRRPARCWPSRWARRGAGRRA
ncbi:RNA-binding protein MEX3D-like [Falco naumanni]|uniref:RNA-binding protein MEX3D-like n=1 Tax=Falco naumanni TaxID=148594 RepID=UPI001ADE9D75|nr:RNA-binding protein MEX3D-like [Falco naumanni]